MVRISIQAIPYFQQKYSYPSEDDIYLRYANINELVSNTRRGDVAVVANLSELGKTSEEIMAKIRKIYEYGGNLLIDSDKELSSARMHRTMFSVNGHQVYTIFIEEDRRKVLEEFVKSAFSVMNGKSESRFNYESRWYWDFMAGVTSYSSAQAALNAACSAADQPTMPLSEAIALYETYSEYFIELSGRMPRIIFSTKRNVSYDILESMLNGIKDTGITLDVFYAIQEKYNVGSVDAWRILYGYIDTGHCAHFLKQYPEMEESYVIRDMYNIKSLLNKEYRRFSLFGIQHFDEFWHLDTNAFEDV